MENRYVYNGQDITLDVIMKIESVMRIIAEKECRDFDDCYKEFVDSKTYVALQKTNSVMWLKARSLLRLNIFLKRAPLLLTVILSRFYEKVNIFNYIICPRCVQSFIA